MTTKNLSYYRRLPYTRTVGREEYEGERWYAAQISELPGLVAAGETRAKAMAELDKAFDSYIEAQLEWGGEIPEPDHVEYHETEKTERVELRFSTKEASEPRVESLKEPEDRSKPVASAAESSFTTEQEFINA